MTTTTTTTTNSTSDDPPDGNGPGDRRIMTIKERIVLLIFNSCFIAIASTSIYVGLWPMLKDLWQTDQGSNKQQHWAQMLFKVFSSGFLCFMIATLSIMILCLLSSSCRLIKELWNDIVPWNCCSMLQETAKRYATKMMETMKPTKENKEIIKERNSSPPNLDESQFSLTVETGQSETNTDDGSSIERTATMEINLPE